MLSNGQALALVKTALYDNRNITVSKVDLKKYFEKAMSLFETGRYKEAISVFENIIEMERTQEESYFTPFAEIYIDKSRSRIREMSVLEDRRWQRMEEDVISEAGRIAKEEEMTKQQAQERALIEEENRLKATEEEQRKLAQGIESTYEKALEYYIDEKYSLAIMNFEKVKKLDPESRFVAEAESYIQKANIEIKREEVRKRVLQEEEMMLKAINEERKKQEHRLTQEAKSVYEKALGYYKMRNYPAAIAEFRKVRELDPDNNLVSRAEYYIESAQKEIKREEERALMAKMEAARRAKIEKEREDRVKEIERAKKEREKERLKVVFERRLREQQLRERIVRTEELLKAIRVYVVEEQFEDAEEVLGTAMAEFPENERFKDVKNYVDKQRIRKEEDVLKKAREIIEEKMLLEIAKKHMIPDEKVGTLEKEKKIVSLVKVPEIRKRLKIPLSVDFKDVELDYVLNFLSEATGVNIIPSSDIDMTEKKVTIRIKNMPLEDALRYVLKSQDLVYRIEEDAVWVATKEELDNEEIETRVYFMNQGIGRFAEFSGSSGEEGDSSSSSEVKTIKDILENAVDWPKDSKLTLDNRTGALILSNIPSNLEIVENLLYNLDVTPVQVLIEARFLEVKVTDVDELGIDWKLNSDWGTKQNNSKQNLHGFASGSGVDFTSFTRTSEGFNLTYQGILSHPQFQFVMHALKEKQKVKTLSAPRITTLNNQTATIEVIDEFIYPTRYEVSLVQFDINGDGDFDDAGETEWANIPQDFVTRDVGILLHVKPSVGADKKTVTLALTPEVSEDSGTFSYSGGVSIPQFKTRNLSTSVIIDSGETIVMGGLIKETNTNIKTKVPVLGDLPFVGGLFRKKTDNVERRNLLIFVTATVLGEQENIVASVPVDEKIIREQ